VIRASHPPPDFADEYYHDADLRIVQAVPQDARDILDIDCGEGRLGEVLKHLQPARRITGIASQCHAGAAESRLDTVVVGTLQDKVPSLPWHSFDCIVASDALPRCANPQAVLERLRPCLKPGGTLIATFPNHQHWSRIDRLLSGETGWQDDALQLFAVADLIRLFLDAGYLPHVVDRRMVPAPAEWLAAMQTTATLQGLDAETFARRTQTWQYVIAARPIAGIPDEIADEIANDSTACPPVTIGACTNDAAVLNDNLLASPCLRDNRHETLMVQGAGSAAEGLNAIIAQARHELVVLAHQDVYLPKWWIARLWQQYGKARELAGDRLGVMGVYGVLGTPHGIQRSGRVADRDFLLDEPTPLPALANSLDELVLIVPKNTPLRFDPSLGFHLYGTDICLSAVENGLHGMVIDAPCHHNSKQGNHLPGAFHQSKSALRQKWVKHLPIATVCDIVS